MGKEDDTKSVHSRVSVSMEEKKRKRRPKGGLIEDDGDQRMIELQEIIHEHKRVQAARSLLTDEAMNPLKRVNSSPMIYQFLPPSNLNQESRSLDHGFDGLVDIPNQTYYMETVPDDIINKNELPPRGSQTNLTLALSFLNNADIDKADKKKLKKMKKQDVMHFLKTRMGGQDGLDTLYQTVESPYKDFEAAVAPVEVAAEEEEVPPPEPTSDSRKYIYIGVGVGVLLVIIIGVVLAVVLSGSSADTATPDNTDDGSEGNGTAKRSVSLPFGTAELFLVTAYLHELDGQQVDTDFENLEPPMNPQGAKVKEIFIEVYSLLGLVLTDVEVEILQPQPDTESWRVQVSIRCSADDNIDLLTWYGYDKADVSASNNEFALQMSNNAKEVMVDRYRARISDYTTLVGQSFVENANPLLDSGAITARRPPLYILDTWENCRGLCSAR